jgi:hypothetical protein
MGPVSGGHAKAPEVLYHLPEKTFGSAFSIDVLFFVVFRADSVSYGSKMGADAVTMLSACRCLYR